MLELDRTVRDTNLFNLFYARLASLGSKLNSRVRPGPLFSLISAFVAMVSDAMEEVADLWAQFNPATATGAAQDVVLGFFERPRYQSAACEQTFTILRTVLDSTSPVVIPLGAAIQTSMQQDGSVRSYSIANAGDSLIMAAGVNVVTTTFTAVEPGALGVISAAQLMEISSGFSGPYVIAGRWTGDANPLVTLGTAGNETIEKWLINNAASFEQVFRVVGRDQESDSDFYARCTDRWSEQSSGSTDKSYESWAKNYIDPLTGSAPFASARVTANQLYNAGVGVAPASQPLINGFTYFMGVEVAVAMVSGTIPTDSQLQKLSDYLVTKKPHTDKVWTRGPNQIVLTSGSPVLCSISYKGPASFQSEVFDIALSYFRYDAGRSSNYRGLGGSIYVSDLVHAIRSVSSEIYDVHVTLALAGKLTAQGDIQLAPFDQIVLNAPTSSIVVAVS